MGGGQEEARERRERREWAKRAIEEEQRKRVQDQFIQNMTNTQWFADTISSFCEKSVTPRQSHYRHGTSTTGTRGLTTDDDGACCACLQV